MSTPLFTQANSTALDEKFCSSFTKEGAKAQVETHISILKIKSFSIIWFLQGLKL